MLAYHKPESPDEQGALALVPLTDEDNTCGSSVEKRVWQKERYPTLYFLAFPLVPE